MDKLINRACICELTSPHVDTATEKVNICMLNTASHTDMNPAAHGMLLILRSSGAWLCLIITLRDEIRELMKSNPGVLQSFL